jgi:trehalose 6-phosphate synthase
MASTLLTPPRGDSVTPETVLPPAAPVVTREPPPAVVRRPIRRGGEPRRRLVVVSNRVAVEKKGSTGGLAVGILAALSRSGGIWFGWSGKVADGGDVPHLVEAGPLTYATLDLKRQDYEEYYNGFANRVLWPLFHFRPGIVDFKRQDLAGYMRVNARFAATLMPMLTPDDLVWVHDYHLIPLGEELRRRGARQPIGFFLHTPFPPAELLRILPNDREIMRAMCAYDLVGFQTESDLNGFRDYLVRHAGGRDLGSGRIEAFGRIVRAEVFPIGIDPDALAQAGAEATGSRQWRRLCDSLRDRLLVIGVDRLDYSKGLVARFEAFERLIENFPDTRGKVTLMQVAPPSRSDVPEYLEIRRALEAAAGQLNGRFAEFDWTPLRYLNKSFNQRTLAGFYRAARVGFVTPLRDGMNLVAKEYVASQNPESPGVLVLSCFAGAARELSDAVLVNPYDTEGMAEALHSALAMPVGERQERWRGMMQVLRRNTITAWRENFVRRLGQIGYQLGQGR